MKTLDIAPRSPWDKDYCERANGSLRDELLNGKIFYSLTETQILIETWQRHYSTLRLHGSRGCPPAPEAVPSPVHSSGSASFNLRPALTMEMMMLLPWAIKALSHAIALALGLDDHGLIGAGMKADVNVINYAALRLHARASRPRGEEARPDGAVTRRA